jgi:hypothetical protein
MQLHLLNQGLVCSMYFQILLRVIMRILHDELVMPSKTGSGDDGLR